MNINKKLRRLILDFNSFIVSSLKIYCTNKYFSQNYIYNLDLFKDIEFSAIFDFAEENFVITKKSTEKFLETETFKENIFNSLKKLIVFENYLKNKNAHEKSLIINEKRIQFIKKINSEYFFVFKDEYNIDIYDINGNYILGKFRFDSNHIIEISKNKFISSKEGMSSEGSIYVLNFICKPEQKPIFNQEQKIFYDDSYVIKIEWVDDQKILLV